MPKIDLEFFEKIIIQQTLKRDSSYIASIIEYIDKELFKDSSIGDIIGIIKDFYVERNTIPTLTELKLRANTSDLKESLKTAVGYIKTLDGEYSEDELISNTEYYLKQRRYALLQSNILEKRATEKEFDLDEIQTESEKISSISLINNLGLDYFGDNDRVVEYLQQKDSLISTGYVTLDNAFGGGFQKEGKSIYDIGGETNVGKSIYLANIALNVVLQGKQVVIISPEMSEMRYAKRISGMLTGIAINSLGDDILHYKQYVQQFIAKHTAKFMIKEVPTKGVSAKNIHAYLKKLKDQRGFKPDLICIDGHGLLKPSVTQTSKHGELQFIVQECRGLSYIHEAPILTVAQLNRGSHKATNPGLDNMAGSWDQLADFDAHVNIWQTDEDRESSVIRFSGKKVRDGAKAGEGYLNINYDTLRLSEEDCGQIPSNIPYNPDVKLSEILDFDFLGNP
jgi:replicative DNA helicase